MKQKGRHPDKALTATKVRQLSKPGRYSDGNGLYLIVDPSGAKRWNLRTVVHGRRRDMGLGGIKLVSLAEAREKALYYRKIARDGGDPLVEKRREQRFVLTFEEAARAVHTERLAAWRNSKHATQWINTLATYAFPFFGNRRVDQIETPDVLRALASIWLTKPETARRVKQRIGVVFDWAKAAGHRTGDNPVDGVLKGLPRQPELVRHHAALPYSEIPSFVRSLRKQRKSQITRLAFEFLILTAARTNEVLLANWDEIDLDRKLWTIPAERMKVGREHRVPLGARSQKILRRAKLLAADSELVFPGNTPGKSMSNMVFLMMLRRMGLNVTAHGFRSAFRDWAAECTSFPREVCEIALAHTIKSKAEAAYRRGDLLEKRRHLMIEWDAFVTDN